MNQGSQSFFMPGTFLAEPMFNRLISFTFYDIPYIYLPAEKYPGTALNFPGDVQLDPIFFQTGNLLFCHQDPSTITYDAINSALPANHFQLPRKPPPSIKLKV